MSAKGYQPAIVSKVDLETLNSLDSDLFVVYTGGSGFRGRGASMRNRVMKLAEVPGRPYPFAEIAKKAATLDGKGKGFTPLQVRSGLFLHKGAKPAVYIACRKDEKGRLVAAWDYPTVRLASGKDVTLNANDPIPTDGARRARNRAELDTHLHGASRKVKGKKARA